MNAFTVACIAQAVLCWLGIALIVWKGGAQ